MICIALYLLKPVRHTQGMLKQSSWVTDSCTDICTDSLEDLANIVEGCGFETVESEYVCVRLVNRAKKLEMKRVFVHGVFRRPGRFFHSSIS